MSGLKVLRERALAAVRERLAGALRGGVRSARTAAAWAWRRRPPASRALAAAFAGAIAVLSAWAVLAQARLPARLPSRLDWAAARALLERDARPGDAVALSPPWLERAREIVPPSVAVLAQRRYAGEDLVGVRRVWMLASPEAPRFRWDVEVDLLDRAARSEATARLGALELTRYDLAFPILPLAFLPDRLARATVWLGNVPCQPDAERRFRCEGVVEVERSVREIDGVPRPCLSVRTADASGAPLALEFPLARVGRTLHGHVGPIFSGAGGPPVRIAVEIDRDEIGAVEVVPTSWTPFRIDMTRISGGARPLSLVLTTPGPLALCLDAMVLP